MLGDNYKSLNYGADRTEWPARQLIEKQLDLLNTEYFRKVYQDQYPVSKLANDDWANRNLVAVGSMIAGQFIDVNEDKRVISYSPEFKVTPYYMVSQKFYENNKDEVPYLLIDLSFEEVYKQHEDTTYLHAVNLVSIDIQHRDDLTLKPWIEPSVPVQHNFWGQVITPEVVPPVVQFNALRKEFKGALYAAETNVKNLNKTNAAQKQALEDSKERILELENLNKTQDESIQQLKYECDAVNAALTAIQKDLSASQKTNAALQNENAELRYALEKAKKAIQDLENDYSQLDGENTALDDHNRRLQGEAEGFGALMHGCVEKLTENHKAELQRQEKSHTSALEQQKDFYDDCVTKLNGQIKSANRKIEALTTAYAKLQGQALAKVEQTFTQLQKVINRNAFFDFAYAVTKPFQTAWHMIKNRTWRAAPTPAFKAPDFFKTTVDDILARAATATPEHSNSFGRGASPSLLPNFGRTASGVLPPKTSQSASSSSSNAKTFSL